MYPSKRGVSSTTSQINARGYLPGQEEMLDKHLPLPDESMPIREKPPSRRLLNNVSQLLKHEALRGINAMKNRGHGPEVRGSQYHREFLTEAKASDFEGGMNSHHSHTRSVPVRQVTTSHHSKRHSVPLIVSGGTRAEFPGAEKLFSKAPGGSPLSARDFSDSDSDQESLPTRPEPRRHRRSSLSHKKPLTRESLSSMGNPRISALQKERTIIDVVRSLSANIHQSASPGAESVSSDYISLDSLEDQARKLALFLTKRKGSASVLSWLLNPHQHIDHLRKQATDLFYQLDVNGMTVAVYSSILKEQTFIAAECLDDFDMAKARVLAIAKAAASPSKQQPAKFANEAFGSDKAQTMTYMEKCRARLYQIVDDVRSLLAQVEREASLDPVAGAPEETRGRHLIEAFFSKLEEKVNESSSNLEQLSLVRFDTEAAPVQFTQDHQMHMMMSDMASAHLQSFSSTSLDSWGEDERSVSQMTPQDIAELHTVDVPIETTDDKGNSLLQRAILFGNLEEALVLFKAGATLHHLNDKGQAIGLNQINIRKSVLDDVIMDYKKDHIDFRKQNLNYLKQLMDSENVVSMGAVLNMLIHNKGAWNSRSIKTLLAYHLGVAIDPHNPPSEGDACQYVVDWFFDLVKMKLGIRRDGFDRSTEFVKELSEYALARVDSAKGQQIIDKLFSLNVMKLLAEGQPIDDDKVFGILKASFCKTWDTHIGVLKTPVGDVMSAKRHTFGFASTFYHDFKAKHSPAEGGAGRAHRIGMDFRSKLDRAMHVYASQHLILCFKTNYQRAKGLLLSSDGEMNLGGVMQILLSQSGGWAPGRSFKRLLAQSLGVTQMDDNQYVDQHQGVMRARVWCEYQIREKLFGSSRVHLSRSLGYLRIMLFKAFDYMNLAFGEKKGLAIINALYNLDTSHLQSCANLDAAMLKFLKSQLEPKEPFCSGAKNTSQLARAFSMPRFLGQSSMDLEVYARAPRALVVHA